MLNYLTNPLIFATVCTIIAMLLCYGDKCLFKYTTESNIYYVKIGILVFTLVSSSLYGFEFISNLTKQYDESNLDTGNPNF